MSQSAFGIKPFSTRVELWLEWEHGRVDLAQVGPTFIMASRPTSVPACKAVVVVSVDGEKVHHPVQLVRGMTESDVKTMILADDGLPF